MKPKATKQLDVVVKYFLPVTAGIEMNILNTYGILAKKGWKVNIHTSKDTYLEKNHLPETELIEGLNVKRYTFTKFGFFPDIDWQNTDAVCLHNFDIFPHLRILLYILFLKLTNKKTFAVFLTPHGGFNPEWRVFSPLEAFIKRLYSFTLGTFLINVTVDGVRAVSEWERVEMEKKLINKELLKVISNGMESEAYLDVDSLASNEIKEKVKDLGRYVIQVGRIYDIKNNETAIKALAKTPSDLKYVLVGPIVTGQYLDKLKTLIKELNLEDRVVFLGVIRDIDKYYIIRHAQAMVHMAIWESFCNVVHEGLSQGLVCIVANNTALPLLVKDGVNGYCVETFDHETVAEKINYVLANMDSAEIQEMKKRNIAFGLSNSWENVADTMDKFYAEKVGSFKI